MMNLRMIRHLPTALVILLTACGSIQDRYVLPDVGGINTYPTNVRSVEVDRVDLPTHAEDSEISVLSDDGVLRASRNGFWADNPDRALTELLAANLDQALRSSVASSPWPFDTPADVRVDVRVRKLEAFPGRNLVMSGQFFLSSPSGDFQSLERAKRFSYSVPISGDTLNAVATAHAEAVKLLADDIARTIARR